jgi:hypothetical protein
MIFQLKRYMLPHEGIIPGARGHKKIIVSRGTWVYCIVYGTLVYWCAYLHQEEAMRAKRGLEDTVSGKARRTIDLDSLLAWNFRDAIPRRVCRPKEDKHES